jgi:hypothetical protein
VNRGVQIILPGLFDLPLDELEAGFVTAELPLLNRILGLSTTHQNQVYSIDAMLSSALALRSTPDSSPLRAQGLAMAQAFAADGDDPDRLLLVAAIHLQADMQGAIAVPIAGNAQDEEDLDLIINDLNELFEVDCYLSKIAEGGYLLRLKAFDAPRHYPHPLSVLGKRVSPFIEQSRQVLPWYQLINEFQMFMHQHPVNEQRRQQGRLPINSLWAWGAGERPTPGLRPAWYCDDPLLNRFAASLGLIVEPADRLGLDSDLDDAVIVDLRLLQLLKSGLERKLDELLLDIERGLLAPVLQALAKRPRPLWLRAGYRLDFELTPAARFKFWRRPRSLDDWCQSAP